VECFCASCPLPAARFTQLDPASTTGVVLRCKWLLSLQTGNCISDLRRTYRADIGLIPIVRRLSSGRRSGIRRGGMGRGTKEDSISQGILFLPSSVVWIFLHLPPASPLLTPFDFFPSSLSLEPNPRLLLSFHSILNNFVFSHYKRVPWFGTRLR
jgi:hypothetical protein